MKLTLTVRTLPLIAICVQPMTQDQLPITQEQLPILQEQLPM